MPRRADVLIDQAPVANWQALADHNIVQANNGSYYLFYIDSLSDVVYRKSSDGITWGDSVLAATAGTTVQLAVWYDRWTDPSGTLGDRIHFAFADSGNDDTHYRTLNTADDSLSTQTVIFAGASTASNGHLTIARAVGGNVYCKTNIDGTAEGGFFRLPNANVPDGAWDAARTIDEALASADYMILLPDYNAADTQDMLAIFHDASGNDLTRKLYDDSANTWGETSIAAGAIVEPGSTVGHPHVAVAPDPTNTRHFVAAWSQVDLANADLRCWIVQAGSIVEVTNIVLNSVDDQGLVRLAIATDTGYLHAFYCGASDGSETWNTALRIYTKVSTDAGTTWGPEVLISSAAVSTIRWLTTVPRFTKQPLVGWIRDGAQVDDLLVNVQIAQPVANYILGV